ncbi:hypothetical protein [Paracoccus sediminicola]|uniref:hypothetical protein n=1 Tax=Paracoccus sediminicola TaxID=3017783 RepID=UPI0022F01693|nr:hypothetical protein [Paracoccus sediminicola]WBU58729.1 hypothetical protein PAF18_17130 [Paracoccus sediminicola]
MRSYVITLLLLLGLFLVAPHGLAAGPSSYICQFTNFKIPGTNTENREWVGEKAMETTVAIDRITGRVIHPVIGNTSFSNVTLLNEGSASWGFKALADSGEGGHVRYYEVQEYDEGDVKTFLAIADGIAFFGECR